MKALARWMLAVAALLQLVSMASIWTAVADSPLSAELRLQASGRLQETFQISALLLVTAAVVVMSIGRFDVAIYAVGGTVLVAWMLFTGMLGEIQQRFGMLAAGIVFGAGFVTSYRERKQREKVDEIHRRSQHPAA